MTLGPADRPGEHQADVANRYLGTAGVDRRTFTGWKATAGIITLVASFALLANWLGSSTSNPEPRPSPTVVTVSPSGGPG